MGSPIAKHADGSNCYTKNCSRRNVSSKNMSSLNTPVSEPTQSVIHKGDNGYQSETIFMDAVIAFNNKDKGYEEQVKKFLELPASSRTKVFTNVNSVEEFTKIVSGLTDKIKEDLNIETLNLSTNKNNRLESDLKENNTNTSIEIKLGSETAVNAGISVIKEILDEKMYSLFPTAAERENVEQNYSSDKEQELLSTQLTKLDGIKNIVGFNYKGKKLDSMGQHVLNSYFKGITNMDEIKSSYTNGSSNRQIRKYTLRPDSVWEETTRKSSTNNNGSWIVKDVVLDTDKANSRLNIFIENKTLGYEFKMVLNGKNNGKKFGKKTPAKLLLNSFNCWFKPL